MLTIFLISCVTFLLDSCLAVTLNNAAIENDILRFSNELESWLDIDIKPCDDFFGYVCSRSLNATSQSKYERQVQQDLEKFNTFLKNSNDEELLDSELKLKQFYNSCQDARSMEQLKSSLMYRSVGGWPAIDDSLPMLRKRHNMTWLQVLSIFHETGISYFFNTKIELISNKRVVRIQPDDTLRFTLRKFEKLSGEIMHLYNVDAGRARLVALETLNFERNSRDIMKMTIREQDLVREIYYAEFKLMSFGSVNSLDWDGYFRKVMGKPLKATDLIIVSEMPKLVKYFELLQNTTLTRFLNWLWIDYLMDKTVEDCKKVIEVYFAPVYQHIVERAGIDKIQMAHMYSVLGQQYEQILANTPWIDEITQQNSKLFLERIMHLTLNGDAKLDNDYQLLTITQRNFYRNLEKLQRFKTQQVKTENGDIKFVANNANEHVTQSAKEFMKAFLTLNAITQEQHNLTAPLNYMLLAEHFTQVMIGGSYETPGAWRSTDSDKEFENFNNCLQNEQPVAKRNFNLNNLLLKILAQKQAWQAYTLWMQQNEEINNKINNLLKTKKLPLNMEKLYFLVNNLVDCHLHSTEQRRQFINTALKQNPQFQHVFSCRKGDALFTDHICEVLKEN